MKHFKLLVVFAFSTLSVTSNLTGQVNPFLNVLPSNSGQVVVNGSIDIIVSIGNTGTANIPVSKLRPNFVLLNTVSFSANALQTGLPSAWTILSNSGSQLRICNSGDVIGGSENRTIILKVTGGPAVAAPQFFNGVINFGNGTICATGTQVTSDNPADNNSQSTIEVIAEPLPLTLLSFKGTLNGCEPLLSWVTESEINTDYFEIIKNEVSSNNNWIHVGQVDAKGSGTTKSFYTHLENSLSTNKDVALHRLKIIDKDGAFKYIDAIKVDLTCSTKNISVFPNPVENGKFNVNINGYGNDVIAVLINSTGQSIKQYILSNGNNQLNVSEISSGIYLLKIGDDVKTSSTVKIFICIQNLWPA